MSHDYVPMRRAKAYEAVETLREAAGMVDGELAEEFRSISEELESMLDTYIRQAELEDEAYAAIDENDFVRANELLDEINHIDGRYEPEVTALSTSLWLAENRFSHDKDDEANDGKVVEAEK